MKRLLLALLFIHIGIKLFAQDECTTATALPVQTNSCSATTAATTVGATQSSITAFASAYTDDDIWFKFTTPTGVTKVTVTISNVSFPVGPGASFYLEARDGNSGICGNYYFNSTIINSTGGNWALTGLSASTQYSIRVYTGDNASRANFNICAFVPAPPTPPTNDDCTTAATIVPVTGTSCTGSTTYNTLGATPSSQASGDASGKDDDIWFTFTTGSVPKSYQFATGSVTYDVDFGNTNIELWPSCDVTTIPAVTYINWWPMATFANFGVLATNTTYKVRVYTYGTSSRISSFAPCISTQSVPINDECSGASIILVNTDNTFNMSVPATTVNATQSTSSMIPCTIPADDDVWFKFVAPSTGAAEMYISNFTQTMFTVLYSGTCGSLTNLKCIYGGNNTELLTGLTPGAVYYLRVMTQNTSVTSAFNIALRSYTVPPTYPTQTNTACSASSPFITTTYQGSTTQGLANDNTVLACYGSAAPNKVTWYRFVATATTHYFEFANFVRLSANANGLGFRVYSGSCTSLTSVVCIDNVLNNNQTITGLTIGNTYYVQMMENSYNGGAVQFDVRLNTPAPPVNDDSTGAINLNQAPTCSRTNGTMRFSTTSPNAPAGSFTQDVWYKFTALTPIVTVDIPSGLASAPRVSLYQTGTLINVGTNAYTSTFSGLTVGAVYHIRVLNTATANLAATQDFSICVSGTPSTLAADALPVGSNCVTADGSIVTSNSGNWLHITHQGKMLASILDNTPGVSGAPSMGAMTAKYFINSGAVRSDASGIEYLDRNFEITPATQPLNPVKVRLYFTKAEFDAMVAANDGDGNDVLWLSDLKIAKFSSVACASTINLTGEVLYNITSYGSISANTYYIEVQVPSFSGFFLKTVAGGLLPVSCNNFNYKQADGKIQLLWSTKTETNNHHFEIERSNDGSSFQSIASIAASNGTNGSSYQFTDALVKNNTVYYYRLKQFDKDGKWQLVCNTLKTVAVGKAQLFGNAYPNPVTNNITIDILKPFAGNADVQIVNVLGQTMQLQHFNLQTGDALISIKTTNLKPGIYSVRIVTSEGVQVQQITKM